MCARPLRVEYDGAFYHVMNRGNASQKIFRSTKDKEAFLKLLEESVDRWKIRIHGFCLMPNHYHLLVETPLGNLSRCMRHINGVYTQRFNKKWKRDGHIFRGRYKAILVEDDAYLIELLRYIHLNAVKAGLAPTARDYLWSSHPFYMGLKSSKWLTTDFLLSYFGKKLSKARHKLHEFVSAGVPEKLNSLLDGNKWPSVFSSEHFEDWVVWNFVKDVKDREIRYQPQDEKVLSTGELKKIMVRVMGISWSELIKAVGYEGKRARKLAIRGFHEYTKCTYGDICRIFGSINASTISRAVKDLTIKEDPRWEILRHEVQNAHCKT
jgi:REP element-mobilizing transposase RayT